MVAVCMSWMELNMGYAFQNLIHYYIGDYNAVVGLHGTVVLAGFTVLLGF